MAFTTNSRLSSRALRVAIAAATLVALVPVVGHAVADDGNEQEDSGSEATPVGCDGDVTADSLNGAFDAGLDRFDGGDYQRAFELDDGQVLWVFQDVYVATDAGRELVHSAAVLQDGTCFTTVTGGTTDEPEAWIAADETTPFVEWYWPLDGYQLDGDTFVLLVAEMEERGHRYLANATPVATWTVEVDLATMQVGELQPAPNASTALYGFDVTTDDEYLYLYGHCHRQFGFSMIGHDPCADHVHLARQPLGQPNVPLDYWTGDGWSRNRDLAASVAHESVGPDGDDVLSMPMQVQRDGDRWISATKTDDWWGSTVQLATAPRPEGPWTVTAVLPVATQGDPEVVSAYFVSFVPAADDDGIVLAMSNNRWDGAYSDAYHPVFESVSPQLWTEREAVEITSRYWLPLGPSIDGWTPSVA
ncbi:MAG: hypothetical protein AAF945_02615 [Actinomycetota bacterium]